MEKEVIKRIGKVIPRIRLDEPMKRHTSLGVGGTVPVFVDVEEMGELRELIQILNDSNTPYFVIGQGTNLLVSDEGMDVVVIHLGKGFRGIEVKGETLHVGAGATLKSILKEATENGLGGLEFVAGIPGTVGGAISSSTSAFGKSITSLLRNVEYAPNTGIILRAELRLYFDEKEKIEEKIRNFFEIKKRTQPLTLHSAGCVFKNPKGKFAGELIDKAGLKGEKVGGAYVSYKHANFIINRGDATSRDILTLMGIIKKRVKEVFGVELCPEIKIVGKGTDKQWDR